MESGKCLCEKIEEVRRQLNAPVISPCRKRDLTKHLWRLEREYLRLTGKRYVRV